MPFELEAERVGAPVVPKATLAKTEVTRFSCVS
jgi:hypothetical protein